MKRVVLYVHIVLLLITVAALVCIYFVESDRPDAFIQATLWLAAVSSALGILNATSKTNKDHV